MQDPSLPLGMTEKLSLGMTEKLTLGMTMSALRTARRPERSVTRIRTRVALLLRHHHLCRAHVARIIERERREPAEATYVHPAMALDEERVASFVEQSRN